jgi:Amt family ammonium transporter
MDGLILLAAGVLFWRVGLTWYVAGLTRAKNATSAVARVIIDLAVGLLAAFVVGGMVVGLAGGEGASVVGHLTGGPFAPLLVFSLTLVATVAGGVVVGPVAERSRFAVVVASSALLAAVVVPVLMVWSAGWLRRLAFVDAAGACWLHVAGGAVALVGAKLVGPRDNKYHRDGSASVIPGHNLPAAGVGSLLMLVGLVGLHGSLAGGWLAAMNTLLAGAAGAISALVYSHVRYGKPDVLILLAGLLGGAIGVSAAATVLPVWAILIGAVGGVLVPAAAVELDLRLRVDDPTGAIAIHLVGGAWATLAAGVFGRADAAAVLNGLGAQVLGLTVALAVAGTLAVVVFKLLGGRLRTTEADEFDGLDLAEHDIGSYPDFQQNSIKSYHLREA